jgi:hypothetical protein
MEWFFFDFFTVRSAEVEVRNRKVRSMALWARGRAPGGVCSISQWALKGHLNSRITRPAPLIPLGPQTNSSAHSGALLLSLSRSPSLTPSLFSNLWLSSLSRLRSQPRPPCGTGADRRRRRSGWNRENYYKRVRIRRHEFFAVGTPASAEVHQVRLKSAGWDTPAGSGFGILDF